MNKEKLQDVAKIIMGTSPSGDTYNENEIGLPLLNGPTEFGQSSPNCTLFTTDSKRECETGDLIFCVRGSTTGRMNWADKIYSLGRGVCSIRGNSSLETKYLKYALDHSLEKLLKLASGGTFPNLTKTTIHNFGIPYSDNRFKIASILSAFDDLIENNTRRIDILEEMAQRIYREWFVHFRYPGHEKDELVDSELGNIPKYWEVKSFSEIANFQNGKAFKPEHWQKEGLPIVKIRELKSGFSDNTSYYHGNDIKDKYHIGDGDLLFAWSASLGIFLWYRGHALLNQHIYNVSPKVDYLSKNYLYYALKISLKEFLTKTQGTTMQHIRKSALDEVKIASPPKNVYSSFEQIIEPINDQILTLHKQTQNLKETRDLLLPKLISGRLRWKKWN